MGQMWYSSCLTDLTVADLWSVVTGAVSGTMGNVWGCQSNKDSKWRRKTKTTSALSVQVSQLLYTCLYIYTQTPEIKRHWTSWNSRGSDHVKACRCGCTTRQRAPGHRLSPSRQKVAVRRCTCVCKVLGYKCILDRQGERGESGKAKGPVARQNHGMQMRIIHEPAGWKENMNNRAHHQPNSQCCYIRSHACVRTVDHAVYRENEVKLNRFNTL